MVEAIDGFIKDKYKRCWIMETNYKIYEISQSFEANNFVRNIIELRSTGVYSYTGFKTHEEAMVALKDLTKFNTLDEEKEYIVLPVYKIKPTKILWV